MGGLKFDCTCVWCFSIFSWFADTDGKVAGGMHEAKARRLNAEKALGAWT